MKTNLKRTLIALLPLGVLVVLLALDISIFGADSILVGIIGWKIVKKNVTLQSQ